MAVQELTQHNFESTVTNNKLVIIDFRAPWCGRGAPGAARVSLDRS